MQDSTIPSAEIRPSSFKQDNSKHLSCCDKSFITTTTLTVMWMEFIHTFHYLWMYLLLLLVLLKDPNFIFFSSVETFHPLFLHIKQMLQDCIISLHSGFLYVLFRDSNMIFVTFVKHCHIFRYNYCPPIALLYGSVKYI